MDEKGLLKRNFDNPVLKETVIVKTKFRCYNLSLIKIIILNNTSFLRFLLQVF